MVERRKDKKGRVLKEGETQRKDGTYDFRWRTSDGKRHSVYAKTLDELRAKEEKIRRDKSDGIRTDAQNVTLNDIYDLWVQLKKGIKDNTFQNYQYMYNQFVYPDFGKLKITQIKRSDIRRFYNLLADERHVKIRTIENIHTVLFQVLNLAVEEEYLRNNPSSNAMKELKQTHNFEMEKRRALTIKEQELFIKYISETKDCYRWKPIFTIMINTGLRVGELTGLRWDDVDFENNTISINHTLVYYNHKVNGCYFSVNTPKTKAGYRTIPMIDVVKNAFLEERQLY
ncbi:MAG: tyrosine-type recombinase/integrase [Coprobacillus cateniformis]|uniref:tyrosine-type recombinase/integrase n=1 Tax=Coprobacillus cateniformis TaxID=100884 RepID=UPI00399416EB